MTSHFEQLIASVASNAEEMWRNEKYSEGMSADAIFESAVQHWHRTLVADSTFRQEEKDTKNYLERKLSSAKSNIEKGLDGAKVPTFIFLATEIIEALSNSYSVEISTSLEFAITLLVLQLYKTLSESK